MTQFKDLLENEELERINEVKEDLIQEASGKENSGIGSKTWMWIAAGIAAVLILK